VKKAWLSIATALLPTLIEGQALANRPFIDGPAPGFVLESWTISDGLPVNSITRIIQSKSGYMWLATFDGLVRFDGVRFTVFNIANSEGLPTNRIVDLNEAKDGSLMVTTELGQLVRFGNGAFTLLKEKPPALVSDSARLVARSRDGKVWVARGDEIFLDGRLAYRRPAGTGNPTRVRSIAVDHEGSLWFSTVSTGLYQLKPALFTMYGFSQGRGDNNVYSVTPASSGGVWAGSWGPQMISHIDKHGRLTNVDYPNGTAYNITSLHEDVRHHRLIAGDKQCDESRRTCSPLFDRTTPVNAIYEDTTGILWFGTADGLVRLDGTKATSFTGQPGAPSKTVRAFIRTRDGTLWMATNGEGVIRFDGKRFSGLTTRNGLPSDLVRALYEDDRGNVWVGTEGKGLARIDAGGRIVNIMSKNGLFDDGIHTILTDGLGRIWMSTNRGIFWVPEKELNDFADGRIARIRSTGYTERHGLRNREANGGSQPAATRASDGRLWFATQDGLAVVDPRKVGPNSIQPNVVIEKIIGGGSPIDLGGPIRIQPTQRDLRFEFTALSFLAPENIRFRYRLSPYDDHWVDGDARRSATYTRVPPGTYTFQVIATVGGDSWTRPAAIAFDVAPLFVETGVFKLLILLAIAATIWAGLRLRLARLRHLADDLQLRVNERTRELREREALLAEKNAQLEIQADQLQELDRAKTRFFANVSHELRTPLTLTIGPLEEARSQVAHSSSHGIVSRIDVALRNARRLYRLVNQILDVSKLEAGGMKLQLRPGNLVQLVRGIAAAFETIAERKRITFRVTAPDDPAAVAFDTDAMEKVIANLLSNAFKFTPDGGGILVSVEIPDNRGVASVKVSDSGPGIPAEHIPHIFDRFYQVDETNTRAQPGTGIGLALARELAELHGGTIEVESAAGGGATFTVSLPLSTSDAVAGDLPALSHVDIDMPAETAAIKPPLLSEDSPTLLIVDDSADLRAYIRSRFESRYRIVEAADGADGIRRAREGIPDLVISDVMMPGTDGHALVAALRQSAETDFIPVILLTAQSGQEQKIAGLVRGADDYIVKPFDMRELEVRVENLIASRRKLRERYSGGHVDIKAPADSLSASDRAFVDRLKSAVETGLSNPDFGVGELAQAVFQDRSHLFRRTKELLGESPSDLLKRVRLEHAGRLLAEGEGSVAEVAYACGFNSVSHFCRSFRALNGVTPSEYRLRNNAAIEAQPAG
jgi:signal transduction histidine kinase/ligand-binding sensor domain-containing protein/AraC-like DNA-binding protein/ActR/RegA family two-component response regulator